MKFEISKKKESWEKSKEIAGVVDSHSVKGSEIHNAPYLG